MAPPSATATPTDGAVLVRLPAADRHWPALLPTVETGEMLTVTVGHVSLLPVSTDDLSDRGYRIVGVAAADRPIGRCVGILVPHDLRVRDPEWFGVLVRRAERVFDLRHGPVLRLLAAEIERHLQG